MDKPDEISAEILVVVVAVERRLELHWTWLTTLAISMTGGAVEHFQALESKMLCLLSNVLVAPVDELDYCCCC